MHLLIMLWLIIWFALPASIMIVGYLNYEDPKLSEFFIYTFLSAFWPLFLFILVCCSVKNTYNLL